MCTKENLLETKYFQTNWGAKHIYILLVLCVMFNYSNLIGQASCAADNTVDVFPSAPMIGNNGGSFTINASDIDDGSTGTLVGISLNATNFTGTSITDNCVNFQPDNEVEVWLFVDNGGTQTSCSTIVNLMDNFAPVIECLNNDVSLDPATGEVTLTTAMIATTYENCNLASFEITGVPTPVIYDCTNLGMQTVNLLATDDTGNSSSISCSFTVVDGSPPVANCVSSLNYFLSNPNILTTADINDMSTDNCGMPSLSISQSTFDCDDVGLIIPVTLTVTDLSSNSSTCICNVSVFDDVDPDLDLDNFVTIFLDDMGGHTFVTDDVDDDTEDNCTDEDDLVWTFDPASIDCDSLGKTFDLMVTVTDENFNVSSGMVQVTIDDDNDPEALCFKDTVLYLDVDGLAMLDTTMIDSMSTDNCGIFSRSFQSEFDCADVGSAIDVTLVVTDGTANSSINNNTAICTTRVIVMDTLSPVVVCILDTVAVGATITPGDVTSEINDNCGVISSTVDISTFDCSHVGDNEVIVTVEDASGNITRCTTMVTVKDMVPPMASAQDITVYLDANGSVNANPFAANAGSFDDCDLSLNFSVSPMSFDCDDIGSSNLTSLVVTDDSGNEDSDDFYVTVIDTLAPVIEVQSFTADLDGTNTVRIGAGDFLVSVSNNCLSKDTLFSRMESGPYADSLDFGCLDPLGMPIDVWVRVSDDGSMNPSAFTGLIQNADTMMTTLTLQAASLPVAIAKDITIELDMNGEATITHFDIDDGSSGLCGNALSISQSFFDCDDVGTNTITLTVTDAFGNVATDDAMVTIEDTEEPVLTVNPLNATFATDGTYTLDVEDMATYTDNCEDATLTADVTSFSCEDAGPNLITIIVTDTGENADTMTAVLTLVDDEAPIFTCSDSITLALDAFDNEALIIDRVSNEHVENIVFPGGFNTQFPLNTGIISPAATVEAPTLPANADIASATLLFCVDADNNSGNEGIEFKYTHPITGMDEDFVHFSAFVCQESCTEVNIPASDFSAISGSMISNITATAVGSSVTNICNQPTVRIAYEVDFILSDELFVVAPTDNCSPEITYDVSQNEFDCSEFTSQSTSPISIDLTVSDEGGNSETCTIDVGVINPPVAIAEQANAIPIQLLNSDGTLSLNQFFIENVVNAGSDVACEPGIISMTPSSFDCSNIGVNTVTLRIENADGGYDEATTSITIAVNPNFPDPCNPCPALVNVNNDPILDDTYISGDALLSSGNVSGAVNSDDVTFEAENNITLLPGFMSNINANFKAIIKECDEGQN